MVNMKVVNEIEQTKHNLTCEFPTYIRKLFSLIPRVKVVGIIILI